MVERHRELVLGEHETLDPVAPHARDSRGADPPPTPARSRPPSLPSTPSTRSRSAARELGTDLAAPFCEAVLRVRLELAEPLHDPFASLTHPPDDGRASSSSESRSAKKSLSRSSSRSSNVSAVVGGEPLVEDALARSRQSVLGPAHPSSGRVGRAQQAFASPAVAAPDRSGRSSRPRRSVSKPRSPA